MSRLQANFLVTFSQKASFTTNEVFEWYYALRKEQGNPNLPDRGLVNRLILNPLVVKGKLFKLDKAVWSCTTSTLPTSTPPSTQMEVAVAEKLQGFGVGQEEEEDEWDRYIKGKF